MESAEQQRSQQLFDAYVERVLRDLEDDSDTAELLGNIEGLDAYLRDQQSFIDFEPVEPNDSAVDLTVNRLLTTLQSDAEGSADPETRDSPRQPWFLSSSSNVSAALDMTTNNWDHWKQKFATAGIMFLLEKFDGQGTELDGFAPELVSWTAIALGEYTRNPVSPFTRGMMEYLGHAETADPSGLEALLYSVVARHADLENPDVEIHWAGNVTDADVFPDDRRYSDLVTAGAFEDRLDYVIDGQITMDSVSATHPGQVERALRTTLIMLVVAAWYYHRRGYMKSDSDALREAEAVIKGTDRKATRLGEEALVPDLFDAHVSVEDDRIAFGLYSSIND